GGGRGAPWVLGGAAGEAAGGGRATAPLGGVTVPVMSLGAAEGAGAGLAAAAVTGVAGATACGVRSLSTASESLASFAAGSVCAFSILSRRSLVLLNWLVPTLEVCSRPALSATISASMRAIALSSAPLPDIVTAA